MKKKLAEIRVKEYFESSDCKKRNKNVVKIVAKLIANGEYMEK